MPTIQEYLTHRRLVVFAGAGCSMIAPTSLPSWWQVNRAVIHALVERAHPLLPEAGSLGDFVVQRQDALKFPPEYFAEVVAGTIGPTYFDVLRSLDSRTPNPVHDTLARLAAKGQLKAIVTTNFDRAIEAAFERQGVGLDVRYEPDQMQELAAGLSRFDSPGGVCQLLKIHGSADAPDTLIDTLSQRKRGLPAATVQCIQHLLRWGHWLFLGYSGADLEADPNYLFLRAKKAEAQGFTWLVRTGTSVLPAVASLADYYGEKAALETGSLPEWLENLLPSEPRRQTITASPVVLAPSVSEQTESWANLVGDFSCAAVLAWLADAAGQLQPALAAMQCVYEQHPISAQSLRFEEPEKHLLIISCDPLVKAAVVEHALVTDRAEGPLLLYRGPPLDASTLAQRVYCLLAARLAVLLRDKGRIDEAFAVCQHAVAAGAAMGALDLLAALMGQYGNLQKGAGDLSAAERMFRRAIAAAAKAPWVRADLHNDLAGVLNEQGRVAEARASVQHALEIRTATGDEVGRAGALVNLATFAPPPEAERYYAEALSVFERLGNEPGRAKVFINLGKLHQTTGDWARSWDSYEAARLTGELIADRRTVAMALHGQAVARDEQKQDSAFALYQRALQVAEASGFTSECASIHNNLARFHRDRKEVDLTIQERQQALALFQEMESPKGTAATWNAMGVDAHIFGRLADAIEPFRLAFENYTALKDVPHRLESGNNYASALYANGRIDESSAVYEGLLQEAVEQNSELQVRMIIGLGKCAFRNGRAAEGVRFVQDGVARQMQYGGLVAAWALAEEMAERLRKDFGYPNASRLDFLGNALDNTAKQLAAEEKYDQALENLETLRRMAAKRGDLSWLARTLANIGYVQRQAGRRDEAIAELTNAVHCYRELQDASGALFPLSHLIPLLEERKDSDGLAKAWEEQGLCYDALDEKVKGAESYARAAGFSLLPFASNAIGSKEEARERATRARQLLVGAQPLLAKGSPALARAEYDLDFCRQILEE